MPPAQPSGSSRGPTRSGSSGGVGKGRDELRRGEREFTSERERGERDFRDRDRDRERERERDRDRRWNDREDRRGDREDRRPPRGEYESNGRYESTPSWANTEVKNTLDDDATFGDDGDDGEFVLGATLDRDADAKIMAEMGWGEMFRASADLEAKAAQEREEIRRQMQRENEDTDNMGSSDFTELPPDHPLMLARAAAAKPNTDDIDFDKLDELLAAKAKSTAAPAAAEAEPEWASEPVTAPSNPVPAWSSSEKPSESSGTSKFASRFGFGLQEDTPSLSTGTSNPWSSPASGGGVPKSSSWGFNLEENVSPVDSQAMFQKFAATPNTNAPHSQASAHITQQQTSQHMQAKPSHPPGYNPMHQAVGGQEIPVVVYTKVAVQDLFSNPGLFGSNANALPSMPTASTAPLPPAQAAAVVAEDPLQRLVSKHRNRKAAPAPSVVPTVQQHFQHASGPAASAYPASVAAGVAARYDAPAAVSAQSSSLMNNPTFMNLPPHQQQQYLRHWEQQQLAQRQSMQQSAQPQQPQPQSSAMQHPSVQSHYVPINRPPQAQPHQPIPSQSMNHMAYQSHPHSHQQAPPQSQAQGQLPPGMLRRPMPTGHQSMPPHMAQQQQTPQHYQSVPSQQAPQHQPGQIHGRVIPNQGVVPTLYGAPPSSSGPSMSAEGGELSRWFSHLSQQQNLPALPPQAQTYQAMQQRGYPPNQQQQLPHQR